MILGVDVWSGYGRIDWVRAKAAGVRFAYVKCTQGNDGVDGRFLENVEGARLAGVHVGAYHFGYPLPDGPGKPAGRSPEDQARRFYVESGGIGRAPGELPPAIDAEWPEVGDWGKWGCTASQMSEWFHRFCVEAERLFGRKPVLYTYPFWWRTLLTTADMAWAADYPLWMASYLHPNAWQPPKDANPIMVKPWERWTFWQFSADKSPIRIPGIPACPIDRDVFHGTQEELDALANIRPADSVEGPTVDDVRDRPSRPRG